MKTPYRELIESYKSALKCWVIKDCPGSRPRPSPYNRSCITLQQRTMVWRSLRYLFKTLLAQKMTFFVKLCLGVSKVSRIRPELRNNQGTEIRNAPFSNLPEERTSSLLVLINFNSFQLTCCAKIIGPNFGIIHKSRVQMFGHF